MTCPIRNRRLFRLPACSLLAALAGLPATHAADSWEALVSNSPFDGGAKAETTAPTALEFRGFVQEGDVRFFNIYDAGKKTSRWVAIDAASGGIKIEAYDDATQQLSVRQGDQKLTLTLKKAPVVLAAAPTPDTGPDTSSPNGFTLAPDEKANLQKIAEEIRRRRALRAQAESGAAPAESAPAKRASE